METRSRLSLSNNVIGDGNLQHRQKRSRGGGEIADDRAGTVDHSNIFIKQEVLEPTETADTAKSARRRQNELQIEIDFATVERGGRIAWLKAEIERSPYRLYLEIDCCMPEKRFNMKILRTAKVLGIILAIVDRPHENFRSELQYILTSCRHLLEPCATCLKFADKDKEMHPFHVWLHLKDVIEYFHWVAHCSPDRGDVAVSALRQWRHEKAMLRRRLNVQVPF